jgi:hypothetical protein
MIRKVSALYGTRRFIAVSENLKGRDHSEDLGVDGRIISERIIKKYVGKV